MTLLFVIVFPGLAVVGLAALRLALLAWDLLCGLLPRLVGAAPSLGQKGWRTTHRGTVGVSVHFSSNAREAARAPWGKRVLMRRGRRLAERALSKGSRRSETRPANFLIYEMSGHLDLLRDAPDGEHPQVGVSAGRGVPLELHVRS